MAISDNRRLINYAFRLSPKLPRNSTVIDEQFNSLSAVPRDIRKSLVTLFQALKHGRTVLGRTHMTPH